MFYRGICHAAEDAVVDPASRAPPPGITMPSPLSTPAILPSHATGNTRVVLLLHLDVDGTVLGASVASGEEPFSRIALEASEQFRFTPALKDGVAIEARFLFEVAWEHPPVVSEVPVVPASPVAPQAPVSPAPPPSAAPAPPPSAAPAATPMVAATPEVIEVQVRGVRVPPGAQTLTAAQAREIPATFGDPLRAVEVLPGVAPVMAGLPYFYVRGAPPSNVGYFVDGVRVPLLWHAFVGPSVIHPATLSKVTLYRGAYPAEYGRYAGAIVTADTVAPSTQWRGEAGIRLVDSAIMGNAPLGRLEHSLPEGSALVSGRYSYTGFALSLLSDQVDLGYWDYQVLATQPISSQDSVGLLMLGAYDHFATTTTGASTEYHRIDVRFDRRLASQGRLRVALTAGHDNTGSNRGDVRDNSLGGRLHLERRLASEVILCGGLDTYVEYYRLDVNRRVKYQTAATLDALVPTRREVTSGAYLSVDYFPTTYLQVSPGVRFDYYFAQGRHRGSLDPRLAARFRLSPEVTVEHSLGFATQASVMVPGVPAAHVTSLKGGLQRSVQASSGISYQVNDHTSANLVLFDTIYHNLSDPLGTAHRLVYEVEDNSRRVDGAAFGAELYVSRRLYQRVGGFLSYTISRSTRRHGTISTLSSLDRAHIANAALAFDAGRHWRLGVRGMLLSGLPVREATTAGDLYHGERRTPPFVRLDLRAEKRWVYRAGRYVSLVGELMNATFSEEITERSCNPVRCTDQRVGPIVMPSLGAEAHF